MSILRIGGIASGFDTEQIVRDLMRIERMKVDNYYQQRQVIEWQKEQFREVINKVRGFRDNYFDVLKPETNMMSPTALKKISVTSSDPGMVTATATPEALIGETTFRVIESATAARACSSGVTEGSSEGERLNLSDNMEVISAKLDFGTLDFDENGKFNLKINGENIEISKTDTLKSVINKINYSKAGVQISYSSFSDTFTVTAKKTGLGYITTDNGGNFFEALGMNLTENGETYNLEESGRDARFEINGFGGTRSGNTFTIDGITYSINKKIEESDNSPEVTISTAIDADSTYNTIEQFINDYNKLIDEINRKIQEERFRNFMPLTDEQKEAMSDREVEQWEEKAKSGLLRNEPALENLLRDMRRALYETVGESHLTEIGIATSSNYEDQGKLVLKNGGSTLKAAIANNPDKVMDIFTRRSDISYSPDLTAQDKEKRYRESGLTQRLSDILNDNIRTTRNSQGKKGILLEQAGMEGDISEFNNYYDRKITDVNKRIDRMNELLYRKEEQYYRQFTAMEKALQQLYSQGDWLMMQMSQFHS